MKLHKTTLPPLSSRVQSGVIVWGKKCNCRARTIQLAISLAE
jgi:hypothetical protein